VNPLERSPTRSYIDMNCLHSPDQAHYHKVDCSK
jgi:hypothetical protein